MRATSSSFLLHDNPFFFLNDQFGCDMWSYPESVFFSALFNVANMILSVLELFFLGGGEGVERKGQPNQAKPKWTANESGIRTDNSNSCIEGSKPYTQFIASVLLSRRDALVPQNTCISIDGPSGNNELVWLIYNIRRRSDSVMYSGSTEI